LYTIHVLLQLFLSYLRNIACLYPIFCRSHYLLLLGHRFPISFPFTAGSKETLVLNGEERRCFFVPRWETFMYPEIAR